jgi:serine/threonine-protein kinase|nr:protein kinase [Kofleriaceae bacterium]
MLVGATLADRYDVLELLGAGGMGEVYRARDRELDEVVALKVIRPELTGDAALVERFRREVKLARRVTHNHVARTYELGRAGDLVYCTMELIDGESLTHRLARGALPVPEAVAIARAVCDGLAAAHAVGVVHRDVKPDNILIAADGRVVVADFGVAAIAVEHHDGLAGTIAYMAPEQATGALPSPAADVYSVGVVLHEMLTGHRAFLGEAHTILDAKQLADHVDTRVAGDVTAELAAIVAAATARDVRARTPSADALRRALAPWAKHAPALAPPTVRGGALVSEQHVVVLAPANAGPSDFVVTAIYDALLGRLARAPRLRVHARPDAADAPDAHVVTLATDGTLALHRPGHGAPALQLQLPVDVAHIPAAAEAAAAAILAAVALAGPATPDRAGRAYELWLRARNVTQLAPSSLARSLALLEEALAIAPDDPRILATLAMANVRRAFFLADTGAAEVTRAAQLARAALGHGPDVAEAHLAMGHLELNIGEAVAAAGHFRVAIARAPQLSEGHEYLGRMLLEANAPSLAFPRLHEALAIAPNVNSSQWEIARAHALAARWTDYDRAVAKLDTRANGRTIALARYAMWRGDVAFVEQMRVGMPSLELGIAPGFAPQMFEIYLDGAWARRRESLMAIALDARPINRRRRAFVAQLIAEPAAWSGDVASALACIAFAVDNGLFDLAWLELCPLLANLRGEREFGSLRARVKQRADAIVDALYGDLDAHAPTVAETMLATTSRGT